MVLEVGLVGARASAVLGGNGGGTGEKEHPVEEIDDNQGDREGKNIDELSCKAVEAAEQNTECG